MPTYDYECPKCAHRFERFHGMNQDMKITCPLCEEHAKKCVTSANGFIFKGSGFYETDYKRKDEKREKKDEKK